MEATLNIVKINVGVTKNIFEGLSNLGIKLDKVTEIIIALTESKILAFVSAIELNSIWFFN